MSLSKYKLTYVDYSNEPSSVTLTGQDIANDGSNYAAVLADAHDLRAAIDGITVGGRTIEEFTSDVANANQAVPTDKNAQRERKWLVVYKDVTQYYDAPSTAFPNAGFGKKFTLDIPTADLSLLPAGHSDTIDPAASGLNAALTTFFTAFEAFQRSPYAGEVEVVKLVAVGRNL